MRKILAKAAAIMMIASIPMGLASCGDSSSDSGSDTSASSAAEDNTSGGSKSGKGAEHIPDIPGKVKTYHKYSSVLVPEGWVLQPYTYGLTGEEDGKGFYLKKNGEVQLEIYYGPDLEKKMKDRKQELNYNFKEELEDIARGNAAWNGIIYEQDGKTCFEVYGLAGLTTCYIKSDTLDFYSDEAKAVMASIFIEDTTSSLA